MHVLVRRFANLDECTIGFLHVDGDPMCFTLEDPYHPYKIPGKTRIRDGLYPLELRVEGGMHEKYKAQFPEHKGMLWLKNVPEFEYIYLHVGTDDEDTRGCILVGDSANMVGELHHSTQAYRRLYGRLSTAILAGDRVAVRVV